MKILRLDLRAFGPFEGVCLDFARGRAGLHIVYGPNEAGKSSALRALKQFFYGIPHNSSDNFLHDHKKLRIAATLEHGDGTPLEYVRRKGLKNTLRGADDDALADDEQLLSLLGGMSQELFEKMFAIDHKTLVEGGREIIAGRGEIGQVLFATGAGLDHLPAVQKELEKEAKDLFLPAGAKPAINVALTKWNQARLTIREKQLPSRAWTEHRQALDSAEQEGAALDARLAQLRHVRNRLARLLDALPLAAQRRQLCQQRQALGPVRILPPELTAGRQNWMAQLATAAETRQRLAASLQETTAEIARLHSQVPASEAAELETLPEWLGRYRKLRLELPRLQAERDHCRADAAALLRQFRPDLSLEDAGPLRLTKKQHVEIQNLGNRQEALVARSEQARAQRDLIAQRLRASKTALAACKPPRDARGLEHAVAHAQQQGDLEKSLVAARVQCRLLQEQVQAELSRLDRWSGSLEALERLPVPLAVSIDRFESAFAEVDVRASGLASQIEQAQRRQADCQRQLEQLQLQGAVPGEQDLLDSRQRRQQGWQLVLAAWRRGEPVDEQIGLYCESLAAPADLALAYESAVRAADETADRLRREADSVAQIASHSASYESWRKELEKLNQQQEQLDSQREQLEQEWLALWQPTGIAPGTPQEMRGWLQHYRSLLERGQALHQLEGSQAEIEQRLAAHQKELRGRLEELDEASPASETLGALMLRCRRVLEEVAADFQSRSELEREIEALSNQQFASEQAFAAATEELAAWRTRWAETLEPLALPADAAPSQASEAVDRLQDLFNKLEAAERATASLDELAREQEEFQRGVRRLAERLLPQPLPTSELEAAERLIALAARARADQVRLEVLHKQQQTRQQELEATVQLWEEARGRLSAMCQEAGCSQIEQLPEIERLSQEAASLEQRLRNVDEQLLRLSGGATLEEFLAELQAVDGDALPGELESLDRQIEAAEADKARVHQEIGSRRGALEALDGSSAAAEAAEQAQAQLALLRLHVEDYARTQLASVVLRRAIERYREKHQDPILRRASELFAELTSGSFQSLLGQLDEKGQPVLVGVRGESGERVGVEGMSEGTADQLYLALRLASLERYLEEKPPVPLIVDDLLITFDNDRAAAALKVLANVARSTQVLFFTHHEHLVELARKHLSRSAWRLHRLREAASPVEVAGDTPAATLF